MYNITVPSDAKRAKLMRALDAMQVQLDDYIISEQTLRLEAELKAGRNAYALQMYENPGSDRPQEIKLNRNDAFIVIAAALAITKQDKTNDPPLYGNYPLFTFPDPGFFLGSPAAGLDEHECLETVYNGQLTIKTNNTDRLTGLSTSHFRYVPERTMGDGVYPQYGPTLEKRGFFEMEPHIILNGQQNNLVEVEIGAGDTAVIAGGIDGSAQAVDTTNVMVVQLHGFLLSEAAAAATRYGL